MRKNDDWILVRPPHFHPLFLRAESHPESVQTPMQAPAPRADQDRQIQRRSHDLFYLHDQPAHDDLGKCNFEDVAAFQFVKQTHLHFRTFNVHVINHQTGIIRKQMPRRLAIPTFNPAHSSKPFALINSPQCFPAQASKSEEVRIASVQ